MFTSPNASFFVSVTALTLSLFNSAAIFALWVFYLSKHFSTHQIKVLDIKKSVEQKKPVVSKSAAPDDEDEAEKEATEVADSIIGKMFNRNKEKLTDSLM